MTVSDVQCVKLKSIVHTFEQNMNSKWGISFHIAEISSFMILKKVILLYVDQNRNVTLMNVEIYGM